MKGGVFTSGKVIIVLDFGYSLNDNKLSNVDEIALAVLKYAAFNQLDCVILAQSKTFEQIRRLSTMKMDQLFELSTGQSTSFRTDDGTTWQALSAAKGFMDQHNLGKDAVLFTHLLHFDRAQKQAEKIGIHVEKPKGTSLPVLFYPTAAQWWCKYRFLWRLREWLGSYYLKQKGQL